MRASCILLMIVGVAFAAEIQSTQFTNEIEDLLSQTDEVIEIIQRDRRLFGAISSLGSTATSAFNSLTGSASKAIENLRNTASSLGSRLASTLNLAKNDGAAAANVNAGTAVGSNNPLGAITDTTKGMVNGIVDKTKETASKVTDQMMEATTKALKLAASMAKPECSCGGLKCKCCSQNIVSESIPNFCLNAEAQLMNMSLKFSATLGSAELLTSVMSANSLPPVCVPMPPPMPPVLTFCLKPYGLGLGLSHIGVCLRAEIQAVGKALTSVDLNCFEASTNGDLTLRRSNDASSNAYVPINAASIVDAVKLGSLVYDNPINPIKTVTNAVGSAKGAISTVSSIPGSVYENVVNPGKAVNNAVESVKSAANTASKVPGQLYDTAANSVKSATNSVNSLTGSVTSRLGR